MQHDVAGEVCAQDVFARKAVLVGLLDGAAQDVVSLPELTPKVDEHFFGLDGVSGDEGAFYDGVRVIFQNQAVFESARLALVTIDTDELREDVFGHKTPFDPRRETRPTATSQPDAFTTSITSSGVISVTTFRNAL
jgi:hypothetical protein